MIERTFIMVKPDAMEKGVAEDILNRIKSTGLTIVTSKETTISEEQAKELYKEHEGKEFYQGLIEFALSGSVTVAIVEGENAVQTIRDFIGATDPKKAEPGTIRADYGSELPKNAIHASDSKESAEREIPIFFQETELI